MLLLLTILILSVWLWRASRRDAALWALISVGLMGGLVWQDVQAVSSLEVAFPKILKDFIMLGMVGFVQTMAVNKRISIWTAILLIFGMFAAAALLDDFIDDDGVSSGEATTIQLDPEGEQLVELKENRSAAEEREWRDYLATNAITTVPAFAPNDADRTELDNYVVADLPTGSDVTAQALQELSAVVYAEPNERIRVAPDQEMLADTRFERKKALSINDPETSQQWIMDALDMGEYYDLLENERPRKRAKIAILDTGVDGRHEDLKSNYFSVDKRYDNDPVGHGTHCAGIAAGVTNNGIGIGSLAGSGSKKFVEITSIKVLNSGGMGTQKTIVAGILEATDEGADVISLSLGGRSNQSRQKAYSQAVKYATDQGVVVIAAAGNSNRAAADHSPANATGIIAVAALDELLLRAPFSNRMENIGRPLAAPGVRIFSTTPNDNYKNYSGTSMACPFVAGLAGVMKSIRPKLTAGEVYEILNGTGKQTTETRTTGRIVQPAAAIKALH